MLRRWCLSRCPSSASVKTSTSLPGLIRLPYRMSMRWKVMTLATGSAPPSPSSSVSGRPAPAAAAAGGAAPAAATAASAGASPAAASHGPVVL
jgi:hypothetical protein